MERVSTLLVVNEVSLLSASLAYQVILGPPDSSSTFMATMAHGYGDFPICPGCSFAFLKAASFLFVFGSWLLLG